MNSIRKFVASTTLKEPLEWNATLLGGDVVDGVRKLKEQPGQDLLVYGSGELVNELMRHDLIDVYRVMLYPVSIPGGKRLFREAAGKTTLTLTVAKPMSTVLSC